MNNIEKLISDYRYKHPLAEKLGGEYIMQSDEAQIDAIQLVCDIFENAPLEQEPVLNRDCEHCSKTYGTLGCCTTVSNKWVYSCKEGQREYLLDKIRAEIERERSFQRVIDEYDIATGLRKALEIIDKYKAESEVIK